MTFSLVHKSLSIVLIAIILCATTAGICHEALAATMDPCTHCIHETGSMPADPQDGEHPSCPDSDHEGTDHCAASCYCSCHIPVISAATELAYSPVVTDHIPQQSFTPPKEIFLSLFVPPDNLS
jgi:hypothetical protein